MKLNETFYFELIDRGIKQDILSKIDLIKLVRYLTDLGLKDAKDAVEDLIYFQKYNESLTIEISLDSLYSKLMIDTYFPYTSKQFNFILASLEYCRKLDEINPKPEKEMKMLHFHSTEIKIEFNNNEYTIRSNGDYLEISGENSSLMFK